MNVRCPICKATVGLRDAYFPFCSERCKLTDLANWADEKYRIPAGPAKPGHSGQPHPDAEDEDLVH